MRQPNLYIILYSAAITIVCGGALAYASQSLKPLQDANIAMEQKMNILLTVMELKEEDNVVDIYKKRVKAFVVDFEGNIKPGMKPEEVIVAEQYKKPTDQRLLPVYKFVDEGDSTKIEYVVLPLYGYGLWNSIFGFVALKADLTTIQGVKFGHLGETPGLGDRITSNDIQSRYKGKTTFDKDKLVSVVMQKGEGQDYSNDAHKVDGMSGATLTAKGVNNMILDYLKCYENYLKKLKTQTTSI